MSYTKGTIAIPHVTGDIQITITATPVSVPNILTEDFTLAGQSYSPVGTTAGYHVSTSNGGNSSDPNAFVTGFIPLANANMEYTITVPEWILPTAGDGHSNGATYSSPDVSGWITSIILMENSYGLPITASGDGTYKLSIPQTRWTDSGWRYFRLSFYAATPQTTADASSIKITAQ